MKIKEGSVHGRFQPLHLGHLEYILAAKKKCDFLWIGITQPETNELTKIVADPHRSIPFNNPLSYIERSEMIINTLVDEGVSRDEFSIIPFPVETPEKLHDFLPKSIPIFTTVCEEWNLYKINLLQSFGYQVIVLWERQVKKYEGIVIREKIKNNDESWKDMVKPATIEIIEKYNIRDRLLNL